jgi:hypothetical protein
VFGGARHIAFGFDKLPATRRLLCRFLNAGMTISPRVDAAGVRKAPRHEIAGNGALAVPRALWGFGGADEG